MVMKGLLFRRFSLLAGLIALASIFFLSYLYYRLHANSPFAYEQIMVNTYEYRVLDSRINIFGNSGDVNLAFLRDNLSFQQSIIASVRELFYILKEKGIEVPDAKYIQEIENSIAQRKNWLATCEKNNFCNIGEWNYMRAKAMEASEALLASFHNLLLKQEETWFKNLRIFYISSVLLLLSTLFFAARKIP
jgi:hypothetical protein